MVHFVAVIDELDSKRVYGRSVKQVWLGRKAHGSQLFIINIHV